MKNIYMPVSDLNWDESTVEVRDEKTGEVHKLEVETVKNNNKILEKVFTIRLAEGEYEKIKQIARSQDLKPAHFARRLIRKAIQEKEDDSKRIRKNK